ncbi:MAG TPA: hypothetical protein VMI32_04865 [Candidatus Solibacter sp.]|nr:hypothetical protein [Candidatus Solibacter sp.]
MAMNILTILFLALLVLSLGYALLHLRSDMREIRSMQVTLPRHGDGSVFDTPDPVDTSPHAGHHHGTGDAGSHDSVFDGGGHGGFDGGHGDFAGPH